MTATTDNALGLLVMLSAPKVDVTRFTEQIEPEHRYASFDFCLSHFHPCRHDRRTLVGENWDGTSLD